MIFSLTVRFESRASSQKEVKRRLRTKALRWRKRDHARWRAIRGVRKSLHKVWDLWSIRGIPIERSRKSIQETGAARLKVRSRIFSIESTRESSTRIQETGARRSTPNRVMGENILTPLETCCVITRIVKHRIHEPSIHEQDFSVFAEEIEIVRN